MGQSNEQSRDGSSTPSFGHLLLVWVLIGSSFWSLGFTLADATQIEIPLSRMDVGLLFGTIVVVLLWIVGFRPSLLASFGYFVTEQVISLFFVLGYVFVPAATPWVEATLRATSITLTAILVFTDLGVQMRNTIRRHIYSLLKLPPQDQSADHK
ncbi:MAG: hypothetical protein ABEH86_05435 [Haloarcula sp.]